MNTILVFLKKDIIIKLIFLALATALWFYVTSSQVKTGSFPGALKINIKNTPSATTVVLGENYAELKIEADRNSWSKLQPENFDVFVDADGLAPGTHEIQVQAIAQVSGIKILSISPSTVFATVEPIIASELPITVKIEGQPADGYVLSEYNINPTTAVVSSPSGQVPSGASLRARLVLNGENRDLERKVELQLVDANGTSIGTDQISINPQGAIVGVVIKPSAQTKTVGIHPIITGSVNGSYFVSSITTSPSTITISGQPETINGVTTINTTGIDINGIGATQSYTVDLIPPSGVTVTPSKIQVTVNLSPITSNTP